MINANRGGVVVSIGGIFDVHRGNGFEGDSGGESLPVADHHEGTLSFASTRGAVHPAAASHAAAPGASGTSSGGGSVPGPDAHFAAGEFRIIRPLSGNGKAGECIAGDCLGAGEGDEIRDLAGGDREGGGTRKALNGGNGGGEEDSDDCHDHEELDEREGLGKGAGEGGT